MTLREFCNSAKENVTGIAAAAALGSCAATPEQLNSEHIQRRYGNYDIAILHQDAKLRISNLFSNNQGVQTTRTYAIVEFDKEADHLAGKAHQHIISGASIGTTLASAGFPIRKQTVYADVFTVKDADMEILRLMNLAAPTELAVHIYELSVKTDNVWQRYGIITEAHHPDYLDIAAVRAAYPVHESATASYDNRLDQLLMRQATP